LPNTARAEVHTFFHGATNTAQHIVWCPETKATAVIDAALDFDAKAGRTWCEAADEIIGFIHENGLQPTWILETHVHADHLTAAPYLKDKLGATVGIGAQVCDVQKTFGGIFNLDPDFRPDGSQFDHLFGDGEPFTLGNLECKVLHTPGHTPACVTYVIGDTGFTGDSIFMPDFGTARCDFPGGDAKVLYNSIQKILALPDDTRLFVGHDYKTKGRDSFKWETTVATEKAENIHVGGGASEEEFVALREGRDSGLPVPMLMLPAVQVNIRGGAFPPAEPNGVSYLKMPLNAL
jgi:glyoxylase-like metal-dependent hydrolase (beta-lactamase superfamily II)